MQKKKVVNIVAWNYGNAFDGTSEWCAIFRDRLSWHSLDDDFPLEAKFLDRLEFSVEVVKQGFGLPEGLTHFLYVESIWWRIFPYVIVTVADLYPVDPLVTGKPLEFSGIWKGLKHLGEAKHLLPMSQVAYDELKEFVHVEPEKMTIIPPIVPEEYVPLYELRPKEKCVIGMINHVERPYDVKITPFLKFLQCFKASRDRDLELHLYGRYDQKCLEAAKGDPRIKYLGPVPWTAMVLRHNEFSAYLSTSKIEGFGYPIMKSKAVEVPVLCYDGRLDPHVKANTCVWNEETLPEILRNRDWEKVVDVKKAHEDVEWCSEKNVVERLLFVYDKLLTG